MDIENKNKIIEGMKNTLEIQSEKIERYEKALIECVNQKGLLSFLEQNEWATQEDYFAKVADEALRG